MYHYDISGLDYVYLANGYYRHETAYGPGISFDGGLDGAIAADLVRNKPRLGGREFKFVRVELDLGQADIGRLFGVSEQSIARWEKGQSALPFMADVLIRLLYREHMGETVLGVAHEIERLRSLDAKGWERRVYSLEDTWRVAA